MPSVHEPSVAEAAERAPATLEDGERTATRRAAPVRSSESPKAPDATTADARGGLARLYGVIHPDPSREGLLDEELSVSAIDELGARVTAHANAQGEYSIGELRPGLYWVRASSRRDGDAHAQVELAPSERERRLDLELTLPFEVWVKVIDQHGAPPKVGLGLLAVATRERPGEWIDEVRGSFNNRFGVGQYWQNGLASERRGDEYLGRVILHSAPPVWISLLSFQRVIATREVHAGEQEVVFELTEDTLAATRGGLRARFVSAQTREPLALAGVSLHNVGMRMTKLDVDGRLEAPELSPGWCAVRVNARGLERSELSVRIEPGVVTDLGEIELQPERTIRGVVVDEDGAGLNLTVSHYALDPATLERVPDDARYAARSSSNGELHIGQLSARLYELRFESTDSERAQTTVFVDLREGSVDDLRVVVPRGVPLVLSSDEQRWRDVRFELVDAQQRRVLSSRLWSPAPREVRVAPGAYSLLVSTSDSGAPQRHELVIGTEPVTLRLP